MAGKLNLFAPRETVTLSTLSGVLPGSVAALAKMENGVLRTGANTTLVVANHTTFAPAGNVRLGGNIDIRGTLQGSGSTLALSGSWLLRNSGTFTAQGAPVRLNGASQTLSGSTVFSSLTKVATTNSMLIFAQGTTQTVAGPLTLSGSMGAVLALRSSMKGATWNIDIQDGRTLARLDVQDSVNTRGSMANCSANCADGGNNSGWAGFPLVLQNAVATATGFTFAWQTDMNANARLAFGLKNNSTRETDIVNPGGSTEHTVAMMALPPCTSYTVAMISAFDGTELRSGEHTITTKCTGNATVYDVAAETLPTTGGAQSMSLAARSGATFAITVPAAVTANGYQFQIKDLNKDELIAAAPPAPTQNVLRTMELSAYSDDSTQITDFDDPVTVDITYDDADVAEVDESLLHIIHWNGTSWDELPDCTVDADANTVSCLTTSFSPFALAAVEGSSSDDDSGGAGAALNVQEQNIAAADQNAQAETSEGTEAGSTDNTAGAEAQEDAAASEAAVAAEEQQSGEQPFISIVGDDAETVALDEEQPRVFVTTYPTIEESIRREREQNSSAISDPASGQAHSQETVESPEMHAAAASRQAGSVAATLVTLLLASVVTVRTVRRQMRYL